MEMSTLDTLRVNDLLPGCEIDLSGAGANTSIELRYRDASNYQTSRTVILEGRITVEQIGAIASKLDAHGFLIPGQVGLPDIQNDISTSWYPELDHIYHRISELKYTDRAGDGISVEALATAFDAVAAWGDSYKPPFYEEMTTAYNAYIESEEREA